MKNVCSLLLFVAFSPALMGQSTRRLIPHAADAKSIALAEKRIATAQRQDGIESPGQIVVVYFTPKDREPAAGHPDRVRRIVQATSTFYEDELARHGFRGKKLNVFRSADGEIAIVDVIGEDVDKNYGKPDGRRIRDEIVPVLRAAKIDPETSALLILCNLMDYDAKQSTISHHSPYYGGGTHLTGTAWQCDSEILDPLRLKDSTPILDGEYGNITIGRHNSIFIGGVIHELGHALALPHCKQREDEAVRGTALMGSGNRTYAQQLRGEGRGTFLTQAHALRLAAHPAFNDKVPSTLRDSPQTSWNELRVDVASDNTIRIRGNVDANVPVHGVIAYFDPAGRSNYDATTATAIPDARGDFALRSGKLAGNATGQLRLVACHVNGASTQRSLVYRVNAGGRPDLAAIRLELELSPMIEALRKGDFDEASSSLSRIAKGDAPLKQIGQRVIDRFRTDDHAEPASVDPASIPATTRSMALSSLTPSSARVGWGQTNYDRVLGKEVLLSIGGDYFSSGIYAHAPAKHAYQIGGVWKTLTGQCGLQSGHAGKVDFVITGDGRMLWSKRGVTEDAPTAFEVDVAGVKDLTLIVTEGGDGATADWGVWIEPTLSR